ncbi:hypothetical protein MXB_739 [Myxobolus squamalis]|nr:hypothetical protein MXB_739 [Myxobolus squamalis]
MPVILLCGFPCSGKSTVAGKLKVYYENLGKRVLVISENDLLNGNRDELFNEPDSEIYCRISIKNFAIQSFVKFDIVIIDSMSYIKSFRYEIYCATKAQRQLQVILHLKTSIDVCREWNKKENLLRYSDATLQAIFDRFEYPNRLNRWDFPMISVDVLSEIPFDRINSCISIGNLPKCNKSTVISIKNADQSNLVVQTTQEIIDKILRNTSGSRYKMSHSPNNPLCLIRPLTPHVIHSLRRKFLNMAKDMSFQSKEQIADSFLNYLNGTLD